MPTNSVALQQLMAIAWLWRALTFLSTGFWIWMLIDCSRQEEDRSWLYILFFTHILGAVLYFVLRKLPRLQGRIPAPSFIKRLLRRKKLQELEAAALRIGNAWQWLEWGNALFELGDYRSALEKYNKALQSQPDLAEAWWKQALCQEKLRLRPECRTSLEKLLALDEQYAYGEASLVLGRTLLLLEKKSEAQIVLEKHLQKFRLPEALYHLAVLYHENNRDREAADLLHTLITDIQSAPAYHARRQGRWLRRARLLKSRLSSSV